MTVLEACEALLAAHEHDCSGFARAVADAVKVALAGNADEIADLLAAKGDGWMILEDGVAAATASSDKFVLGALRGDRQAHPDAHGHVVVVVPGPLAHDKYPSAFWGSLGGTPGKDQTINWAWTEQDRDKVVYAAHVIPA
jgi:hypothetical protein